MSSNTIGPGILRYGRWPLMRYSLMIVAVAVASLFMWPGLLKNLFSDNFMPHGMCLLWEPKLLWLHAISDSAIGLSYVAISFTLAWLVHRARRDIPFHWVFLAFGMFIIACGSTHLMDVVTLWKPYYWLSGDLKLITAIASVATAVVLPPLVPKTLAMIQAAKLSEERKLQIEAQNQDLEEMTRKLRELDDLKTQFFANVSHELRTPLALTLGRTEKLLSSGSLSVGQQRELEVVHRNARQLLKQVNDLLDISKLEAGRMGVTYSKVDLARIVRRTIAHFDSLAADRQMKYSYEGPDSLSAEVDIDKFERALLNLLSNAFKFTPDGGSIRCHLGRENNSIVLGVGDSGPGIPQHLRDAVFDRFRQLDSGSSRRFAGTGLGLAIVKDFVELHHGEVHVEESSEGGAQFVVTLPLSAPNPADVKRADDREDSEQDEMALQTVESLQPSKSGNIAEVENALASAPLVLVVEDNAEMNNFIVESLASEYRVVTAMNGTEGLQKALALRPDLILSDVMMPGLSGEELLHELRSKAEFEGVPVILLTARADQPARVRVLRQGAQDYIMKPFSVEELRVRVRNLAIISQTRKVLQRELSTQNHDIEELAHEVSLRKRQLHSALDALRASEARFRRLADSNIIGVITATFDGQITEANDAFLAMVGYSREDLDAGRLNWLAMTPEEHADADQQAVQQLISVGTAAAWEKEYLRKDGSRVPVLVGAARIEGAPGSAITFALDLSEQKRTEARVAVQFGVARVLAESSDLADAARPILQMIGEKLKWDYGEMWQVNTGRNQLECVNTWVSDAANIQNLEALTRTLRLEHSQGLPGRVWSTRAPQWIFDLSAEPQFLRAGEALRLGLLSAFGFPVVLHGQVLGVFAFFCRQRQESDEELMELMTGVGNQVGQFAERKRWEAALRASEEQFRSLVAAMPQIVWAAGPDGGLDFYNQRWYDYTGLSYEQTKGWGWQPVIHPDDLQLCLDRWTESVRTGRVYEIEYRFKRHDGSYRWHLGRAVPLRDSQGRIVKWFGTSTDIDDQKRAEAAKSELAAIVESSDDAIIGKTLTGAITSWNSGAEKIFGYKAAEVIGQPIFMLCPPDRIQEENSILQRLRVGQPVEHLQTVRMRKDGTRIDVSVTVSLVRNVYGQVVGASTIARDVTEIRRAEAALRNSEKHATVGRMAATMAHEINNPLEAVSNVLYLLENRPSLDEESRQYVSIAAQEMDRIAHIVKQTLGFYRESPSPVLVNVPELVKSVIALYARKLKDKSIQVEEHFEEVRSVPAYPAELRQVFSNLIINAIEASGRGGRLNVRIHQSRDWSDPNRAGVRILVSDGGTGIRPEDRSNLFEPFFTTKGEKGTGLGLWVSNGIIQKHEGKIRVRSRVIPGRTGTCFSVFLPDQLMGAAVAKNNDYKQSELFSITE